MWFEHHEYLLRDIAVLVLEVLCLFGPSKLNTSKTHCSTVNGCRNGICGNLAEENSFEFKILLKENTAFASIIPKLDVFLCAVHKGFFQSELPFIQLHRKNTVFIFFKSFFSKRLSKYTFYTTDLWNVMLGWGLWRGS